MEPKLKNMVDFQVHHKLLDPRLILAKPHEGDGLEGGSTWKSGSSLYNQWSVNSGGVVRGVC